MYRTPLSICLVLYVWAGATQAAPGITLYVAPDGNDGWSGTLSEAAVSGGDGPLASLAGARDRIRKTKATEGLPEGGVVVELAPGTYRLEETFLLTAEDSGTADAPVAYRAREKGAVLITGAAAVDQVAPVTEADILARLAPEARDHVVQADLGALGITEFGSPAGGGIELFFQGAPMTLARWPNEGFARIKDIVVDDGHQIHGQRGSKTGQFVYEGDRPSRWAAEPSGWLHGYWFWDWSDERQQIESIDPDRRIISVVPPYHSYGYRVGQWFYAMNLLAELDAPGEWYLDRQTGILYFWPPSPIAEARAVVSVSEGLLDLSHLSHVTFEGLTFEACRGTAVTLSDCTHTSIVACTLRNLGDSAVTVAGGTDNRVTSCHIYQTGKGGISLRGGDRAALTPARHVAENNHIHHFGRWNRMYTPAVSLSGVGCRAAHNLIHDAPHMAIGFGGNDHTIELNEIHHVCLESNDAGAIYAGRDWTMRGTVIRHNYLHHIVGFQAKGCVGVYLDDMFCGTEIYGNLFYQVTRAAFIGGGRDCTVENNIFVDCRPALHIDARAMNWASGHVATTMTDRLQAMPYASALWRRRYPQLEGILNDEPAAPKGNLVARNLFVAGRWDDVYKEARPYVTFTDNHVTQAGVHLDTPPDFASLQTEAAARIPNFHPLPLTQIGPRPRN